MIIICNSIVINMCMTIKMYIFYDVLNIFLLRCIGVDNIFMRNNPVSPLSQIDLKTDHASTECFIPLGSEM